MTRLEGGPTAASGKRPADDETAAGRQLFNSLKAIGDGLDMVREEVSQLGDTRREHLVALMEQLELLGGTIGALVADLRGGDTTPTNCVAVTTADRLADRVAAAMQRRQPPATAATAEEASLGHQSLRNWPGAEDSATWADVRASRERYEELEEDWKALRREERAYGLTEGDTGCWRRPPSPKALDQEIETAMTEAAWRFIEDEVNSLWNDLDAERQWFEDLKEKRAASAGPLPNASVNAGGPPKGDRK